MLSRPRRRLLHTSDVHLGAYDFDKIGDSRAELHDTFQRVIDIGLEYDVDLALIAGDFFDHARVSDDTIAFARDQLARLGAPVVIGPGNHDHVGSGSIYDRTAHVFSDVDVRVIRATTGESIELHDLQIEVWGKAHDETDSRFRPFADPPERGSAPWQIAIGHGHYIHPEALRSQSFHILERDLVAANRDYVALGHWERMTRVSAGTGSVAAYSGAPKSLSIHNGGYVMVVDLEEDGSVRLTAVPIEGHRAPIEHHAIPTLVAG